MGAGDAVRRNEYRLFAAWAVSMVATMGSLYFSEIKGYTPCDLCWFQRIFMYPLTIMLGIACFRRDAGIARYVLPLAAVGGAISLYHILYQHFHQYWDNSLSAACGPTPCTVNYVSWFGFITIPVMALTAFILIILCLWRLAPSTPREEDTFAE
ncbi:disulfide oxidoreductase [Paenibacillus sp. JX-17]|uniref:Disulfide oxidoreductase n=1 Tax=Paenibacillus lacisoli TaxID=3064525 RepID=A0ABT9CC98_9BACL|nr:disulfide oxidoreductase [Paenibacillus sp. JX-17]MDO7905233.1 disulfide oxidoreductase [Paenibacillus sp. JX-17]